MEVGRARAGPGPVRAAPDRRSDPGDGPGAAGRLQRRARHAGSRDRPRRSRPGCGRRAAACPGSARSGCRARAGGARSRSTSTTRSAVPLAKVVAEITRLAAEHGARAGRGRARRAGAGGRARGLSGRSADQGLRPEARRDRERARLASTSMAQTKKKRRRKHRGTQGGRIDTPSRPRPRAQPRRGAVPGPQPDQEEEGGARGFPSRRAGRAR